MPTSSVAASCGYSVMRIAIIGSRDFPYPSAVLRFITALPLGTVVISGHGGVVDLTAEQAARARGLVVESYPADWTKSGRVAGFIRNAEVVNRADFIVAFWDGCSPGTRDALNRARRSGKQTFVVPCHWPSSV
jgi:hypothetical protein